MQFRDIVARKQIIDSKGARVPYGHEVDHIKPLYTKMTKAGKQGIEPKRP